MQTEAVFESIGNRIEKELQQAKSTIFIAVAWFTNKRLFSSLVEKATNGCAVNLIISNDRINESSQIDFNDVNKGKSKVYKIGNGDTELMHNKFCVIDYDTVITGSYNWSYKAESDHENIIITKGDSSLAWQFINEFNSLRKRYYPNEPTPYEILPLAKIIQRLEILKNYVSLEDTLDIDREKQRLKEYQFHPDIAEIIQLIEEKELAGAINKIQSFIYQNQQLAIWIDPELAALKLEVKNLENQLNAYDNERADLEKVLAQFKHRHNQELGSMILEILKLRKLKVRNEEEKFEEAQNDEKEYQDQLNEDRRKEIFYLNEEETKELKKLFRKATTLCHPDKFANEPIEIQKQAEEMFKELNEANEKNDLQRVCEILKDLENKKFTAANGLKLMDKEILRNTIARLKQKLKKAETELLNIKKSEAFEKINSIEDWDLYFKETKEKLELELAQLSREVKL
jgi:hypothetical protein